ncbi:Mediator Of Rna polymerase Ii Transcription Subunit 12 [Manis pentadactyla]|nr:Mediator Of Rna polymerase Ii Transcription Subunit 12 [Manis pentadactyla]
MDSAFSDLSRTSFLNPELRGSSAHLLTKFICYGSKRDFQEEAEAPRRESVCHVLGTLEPLQCPRMIVTHLDCIQSRREEQRMGQYSPHFSPNDAKAKRTVGPRRPDTPEQQKLPVSQSLGDFQNWSSQACLG